MRKLFTFWFLMTFTFLMGQGTVIKENLYCKSLENPGGEDPNRVLSIYLPNNYDNETKQYPVIYFLPGFTSTSQDVMDGLKPLLDEAITTQRIAPVIVVVPDHYTLYRGSYFSNSELTGNWIRYTNEEVVAYMDEHFRTLPKRESRVLAGWSSGGFGTLKIGMQSTHIFAHLYAMSPGLLLLSDEFGPSSPNYKRLGEIESREVLTAGWNEGFPNILVAAGRAFAPNKDNPPFYADMPVTYKEGKKQLHDEVLQRWNQELPFYMVDDYAANLRELISFKLEWGRYDDYKNVITSCRAFSEKLENLGVDHVAEEYNGTHFNKIFTPNGRIATELFPFLNARVQFE